MIGKVLKNRGNRSVEEAEAEEEEPSFQAYFHDFQKIITFFLYGILACGKNLRLDLDKMYALKISER